MYRYSSLSSQTDIEQADIEREKQELKDMPEIELQRLAEIYEDRGLNPETALEVAKQLSDHDALGAHVRDELGIKELPKAKPLQAAIASGIAFTIGGVLPLLVSLLAPMDAMIFYQYICAILFLVVLGATAAKTGGSNVIKAIIRITVWGTLAMGLTALVGYLFGVNV